MSVSVKIDGLFILTIAGVAGAALLWTQRKKIAAAAGQAAQTVNPANPDNAIAGAVNNIGEHISGDPNFTVGGELYDVTHPYDGIAYETDATGQPTERAKTIGAVEDGYQRVHGEMPDYRTNLQRIMEWIDF